MPNKINLIGQQFGRLTVIEPAENKGKRTQWLCKCECGNIKICLTDSLRSGRCKSCGCLRKETAVENGLKQLNDLTGKTFGQLTVLRYAGSKRKRSQWLCKCTCGKEVVVTQMELIHGDTLSCGCLKSSFGEQIIENILKENNFNYKKEFVFSDLVSENNLPLRFDFAILNSDNSIQCLIEYDGEQHFLNKTDKIWTDTLQKRQQRDKIKNQYCINNNILLYRIPYWEKNNLSLDLLFNKKYLVYKSNYGLEED